MCGVMVIILLYWNYKDVGGKDNTFFFFIYEKKKIESLPSILITRNSNLS
jgi:hypothetical protein